jgi:predicted nucleotidyltransferase
MGSVNIADGIGAALFGKARRGVLALLFMHPDQSFYLRQLVRLLGVGQGAVQRELARLGRSGLVLRRQVGSQIHYQANSGSPVFTELRTLMIKSAGVADALREALAVLGPQIAVAFVYGSMARGEPKAESDVDLMVIGDASFGEVVSALQPAQEAIGREVNPTVYSPGEYRAKVRAKHHFVGSVANSPKIFLVGGDDELKRVA